MTRFIGDVCLVMSIVKVHWCKLPVSNYYNFIEFFYPNFFLDWLSCEPSEQNCLNCHNFFSGCYEQFVLVYVYIYFFVLLLFYTVILHKLCTGVFLFYKQLLRKTAAITLYYLLHCTVVLIVHLVDYLLKHCLLITNSGHVGK